MSYKIFEIQDGNLVITDPKQVKGIARAKTNTIKKFTDPMQNTTDEDYTDYVSDMGCWDEDDNIDLDEAFI